MRPIDFPTSFADVEPARAPVGFALGEPIVLARLSRRSALRMMGAAAGLAAAGPVFAQPLTAPTVFEPNARRIEPPVEERREPATSVVKPSEAGNPPRGRIPPDFWQRPRELWLRRRETGETIRAVYWDKGRLQEQGYWACCALLRDVREHVMTTVDQTLLDVLRGITGYYEAWGWPHPLVINSGYRTERTNRTLLSEGAAKNSLHLHGRAADVWMPGVPTNDIASLAWYFRSGGVGFYPQKKFVHVDTGGLRIWRG